MSDKEDTNALAGNELGLDQVEEVAGGNSCGTTVTAGTGGVSVTGSVESLGSDIIKTYEGIIDATSYAIERIAGSLK
ncbi:MAG: hypothetical protein AB7P08_08155 [Burkholderiales bacterium]